jgi:hypothetical protein
MFLIDDILMSPVNGLIWVMEEIRNAVEADRAHESEAIMARLSELYILLETGQTTEEAFDAEEKTLLDRLDVLKARDAASADDGDPDDDDADEDDSDEDEDEDGDEDEDAR